MEHGKEKEKKGEERGKKGITVVRPNPRVGKRIQIPGSFSLGSSGGTSQPSETPSGWLTWVKATHLWVTWSCRVLL